MLTILKPVVEKGLQPVGRALIGVNPNVISLLGLIFPVLFFWFVMQEWYAVALVTFVFLAVDLLDGMVARASGRVTPFGGFLDSTIDRFADFTVIAAFGFAGLVRWNVILPLLLLSFLISYIRSRTELAAKGNLSAAVGLVERTERLIVTFLALLLYLLFPDVTLWHLNLAELAFIVLTALSAYTVGQRILFAYKHL